MKSFLLISLLLAMNTARGGDFDPEAPPSEIEALRKQLVADEDRIARLETLTGLLMAAYQADMKEKAMKREPLPEAPALQEIRP